MNIRMQAVRAIVSQLPREQQIQVTECAAEIKGLLLKFGYLGRLAMMLAGIEVFGEEG